MRVRVHRGTHEIGGTCIEAEAFGERIVLDLGLPLNADAVSPLITAITGTPESRHKIQLSDQAVIERL